MDILNSNRTSLSAVIISLFVFWVTATFGCLTFFTHVAQIFSIQFRIYAIVSLLIAIGISVFFLLLAKKRLSNALPLDFNVLIFVLLIGVVGGILSVSMRRIGRISPEEYMYGTNPVYLLQHTSQAMGFEDRTLYSGKESFYSVSYHTSGAYEYILGAFATIMDINYATTYYRVYGFAFGFIIPLCIFLTLVQFSERSADAAMGTFASVCLFVMLGEGIWTPGAYSFVRIFEGKIIILFAGIPLFIFFSLDFLKKSGFLEWVALFLFNTMAIGLSSTSVMIFPILGGIIFLCYWITFNTQIKSLKDFILRFSVYFSSFIYLILFALFIAYTDTIKNAVLINNTSPSDYGYYISGYINKNFPITPLFCIVSSVLVLFLAKGKARRFLFLWMALALLLALNPLSGYFLLKFFRGVYFRLFYIFPFLINIGLIFVFLFAKSQKLGWELRSVLWAGISVVLIATSLLLPSSIFQDDRYAKGSTIEDEILTSAKDVVQVAPKGVMLAPYPLSSAINMWDSDYPQLISRQDNMEYLLLSQGRVDELDLRCKVSSFFSEEPGDIQSFMNLVKQYPEIRSIVISRSKVRGSAEIQIFLETQGFTNKGHTRKWLILWR